MNPRTTVTALCLVFAAVALGWWARGLADAGPAPPDPDRRTVAQGPCPDGAAPLYWRAPMDPSYVRDAPGKSPMGMDLVPECRNGSSRGDPQAVVVDAATIQSIGVRTTRVERGDLARTIRAVGRVAYDERRVSHVHTKVQGWVEKLSVDFVGQPVRRGEPLLEIYSPELVTTQEELLLAAGYRDATGSSPFEDVRSGGEALFDAARRRLALWDIRDQDVDRLLRTGEVERTLTLHAPASGVITQLGVRSGMEVGPNTNLYTIADLSRVWVLANVYEYELPWLEVGQQAFVELASRPGEALPGRLTYIAPFLDPATRTAEVRLELDNADGHLKPEMFGNVRIDSAPRRGVIAVPSEAVIRSGERTLAIVALGDGRFEPRTVELGLDGGEGRVEVRSGLEEGEEVVVSSQFLIDSESNLKEAVRKLISERKAKPAAALPTHEPSAMQEAAPSTHDHSAMPTTAPPAHDHSTMQED